MRLAERFAVIQQPDLREALPGLFEIRAAGFILRRPRVRFRGGFALNNRESAGGQAVADFTFDLQLHLTGDFHTPTPPLVFQEAARHVPLRPESANSVMAAFYPPGSFHLE